MNRRSTQSPVEVLASLTCDSGDTELWLFLPTRESPEEMSGEEGQTAVGADGPTRSELAARERAVLKSIDGVTSVTFNARKMREPLNKDTLYVRVRGQTKSIVLHCSQNLPDHLALAQLMFQRVAAVLGEEAVAEGRRRAEAAEAPVAAPASSAQGRSVVRIGRYFDRDVSDPSGLTFEEWQPIAVLHEGDVGKVLSIAGGVIKVGRTVRPDVYWAGDPPYVHSKTISKIDASPGGWVEFQEGGRIRNPPSAGDFVVNATELRAIAFSMQPLDRQLPLSEVTVRKSGRLAAIVSVPPGPLPKRYSLDVTNDNEIRAKCW